VVDRRSSRDVARERLYRQHIASSAFARPAEAVAWLGALQAQDYLGALWAVGLRLASAREADVEAALADGSMVRTWPLRGTLHLVAATDARWILELLGARAITSAAGRFLQLGLDDATFARARRVLGSRLERDGRLTRAAAYEALERAKVSTAGQRGMHILWRLAHERLLCFGPREGKQQTFVLFDAWVAPGRARPRDEALGELALRYFTGHGPATLADFAWWSGLPLGDARVALQSVEGALSKADVGGRVHFVGPSPEAAADRGPRAHVLPAFDEFLVGYADRSAVLPPARSRDINDGGGMLSPVVVVDARVVGTWRRTLTRREVAFEPSLFEPIGAPRALAVAAAVRRYADFLGLGLRGGG
jgi:hypothetical protein